ncbi:MAG: filamentous hemagglutinin N-terminal domain-containing protein [Candidatus Magnetomorum sp.]|nr:filamentous hemagglutinin N-terminal domain-containing protein [Candidatus Magnetomorum sp.]
MNRHIIWGIVTGFLLFSTFSANALDSGRPHGITENSLGTTVSGDSIYTISGGTSSGNNLFHGFSSFHLHEGEQAIFKGLDHIDTIIARITGGEASWINGTITSEISNADVYLLNPSGFILGPHAALDLTGSFHVSTADRLVFDDQSVFYASQSLSENFPEGHPIGFEYTANSAFSPIIIQDANLSLNTGQTFSIVGGDVRPVSLITNVSDTSPGIRIQNSHIQTPGGSIRLASVASEGVVRLDGHPSEQSMDIAGNIVISDESVIQTGGISAESSGHIYIYGGLFFGDHAEFNTGSKGNSGDIEIQAQDMTLRNHCRLDSQSYGNGDGGDIQLTINNQLTLSESDIQTNAASNETGNAGHVRIAAKDMTLTNASQISTDTSGAGNAGQINLESQGTIIVTSGSEIRSKAWDTAIGNAGDIRLNASDIIIKQAALISADTDGKGNAASVTLIGKNLSMDQKAMISSSSNSNRNGGDAGTIDIRFTGDIDLTDSETSIQSLSLGEGAAGNIKILANNVFLNHQATISSSNLGDKNYNGDAGTINIIAGNTIQLANNSSLATSSNFAGGGQINSASSKLIYLSDSTINTSVSQGWGSGGDIFLTTQLMFTTRSTIQAKAENGQGGNIDIRTQQFLDASYNTISASSRLGIDGRVDIMQPTSDITMDVSQLPDHLLDATARLDDVCAARFQKDISIFSLEGKGALPNAFNDWIPGSETTYDRPDIQFQQFPNSFQYLDELCPFTEKEKQSDSSE